MMDAIPYAYGCPLRTHPKSLDLTGRIDWARLELTGRIDSECYAERLELMMLLLLLMMIC